MAKPKQIAAAHHHQHLLALGVEPNFPARERVDRRRSFQPIERSSQASFTRATRSRVSLSKLGQFATGHHGSAIIERSAGEGVTDPNVPIEIGQRSDAHWVGLVALDDYGEPET